MTVSHARPVGLGQRLGHLRHHPQRHPGRQRSLIQPLVQGRPADQVADQVGDGTAAIEFRLAELPDFGQPRRRQLGHGLRDQAEFGLRRGVRGRKGVQHLDRHVRARSQVRGPPHPCGSPGPDRLDQPESAPDDR
jgi:hypothetical protein